MSDLDNSQSTQTVPDDPLSVIRDELKQQLEEMKESMSQLIHEKDEEITKLKQDNSMLQREVARSMIFQPEPTPKSEEELYKERVEAIAIKAIQERNRYV